MSGGKTLILVLLALGIGVGVGYALGSGALQAPTGAPAVATAPAPQAPATPAPPAAPAKPATPLAPPGMVPASAPVKGIDWKGSPAVGDPATAKVIVVIFSDFQCPVCSRAAREFSPLLPEVVAGEALVVFKQNALEMHKNAKPAALASLAAHRQGAFWAFHDKLFENANRLGEDDTYTGIAQGLGLDMARFAADRADAGVLAQADAEAKLAFDLDALGTPSFFVNGKKQVGWGSAMGLKRMIELEKVQVDKLMAAGKDRTTAIRERYQANCESPAAFDIAWKSLGL